MKVYTAELYVYGGVISAVAKTVPEAKKAVMHKYTQMFIEENGVSPEELRRNGKTYYDEAASCIEIHAYVIGLAQFR